jgi:hypothetical protein
LLELLLEHPCPDSPTQSDRRERLLNMSLAQFAREGGLIEVGVDWLEASLWFVPTVADAACLVRQEVGRGRIWTAHELMNLMSMPNLTVDEIRLVTVAKLAFAGQVVSVQPR